MKMLFLCMMKLPEEDPQCLLQVLHGWEVHQSIDCHEEFGGHQCGLAKVL